MFLHCIFVALGSQLWRIVDVKHSPHEIAFFRLTLLFLQRLGGILPFLLKA